MSPRTQLLFAIAVGTVAVVVTVFTVRHEILGNLADEARTRRDATEKLTHQVTALETRIATLEAAPAPDTSGLDAVRNELQHVKEAVAAQETRLSALNEKPAVSPVSAAAASQSTRLAAMVMSGAGYMAELAEWEKNHPEKTKDLPELHRSAATGLPTELLLKEQFHAILTRLETSPPVDSPKLLERINTHLSGLVSIKKTSETSLDHAGLRRMADTASLETLAAEIDAMPAARQTPFADWRDTVRRRAAALAELRSLNDAGMLP